jgi:stalled ribosome rescue protein Dom34
MENKRRMGVWMDYESAYLIELMPLRVDAIVLKSKTSNPAKKRKSTVNADSERKKQEELLLIFNKKIANEISKYGHVVLFGPTEAKTDLMEFLKTEHTFKDIKIETEETEKMNDNQKHAFVKNYFTQKIF